MQLWRIIEKEDADATMIYPAHNEQGFDVVSTRTGKNSKLIDFDGVLFPAKIEERLSPYDMYAKPHKTLLQHMIETGIMAEALMREGRAKLAIENFARMFNLDKENLIQSIAFICATHDIGKCHPYTFSLLRESGENPDLFEVLYNKYYRLGYLPKKIDQIRHERYSRQILTHYFIQKGCKKSKVKKITSVLAYHHQGKESSNFTADYDSPGEKWEELQTALLDIISDKWKFDVSLIDKQNEFYCGFTYWVLGLMISSDWIVSGEQWENHINNSFEKDLYDSAVSFLKENAMTYVPVKDMLKEISWSKAYPFEMNPLQTMAVSIAKTMPLLTIIEDVCGGGKTEAALAMMVIMGALRGGIYWACPTINTAKAMTKRIRKVAEKLGCKYKIPEFDSSAAWSEDVEDKVPDKYWSASKRHQMFYPVAVGTIDQLLDTVCTYRYASINQVGLSDKIIVIDEMHAYDAFMQVEIKSLLQHCVMFNIQMILLSATLPTRFKADLLESIGCDEVDFNPAYPLITSVYTKGDQFHVEQIPIEGRGKTVSINCIKSTNISTDIYNQVLPIEEGIVLAIESTVNKANALYDQLKEHYKNTETVVMLYHARDSQEHKDSKTKELERLFGKNRSNRPKHAVIVATSLVEQSLDIDVDYLFSAYAPIDLIIQRIGRWHRHDDQGTIREKKDIGTSITIFFPEEYGRGTVYNQAVLRETERVLTEHSIFNTVKDVRHMIDDVYYNASNEWVEEERRKRIAAGSEVLSCPIDERPLNTLDDQATYVRYQQRQPNTRYIEYITKTIMILTEDEINKLDDFSAVADFRYRKAVSVPEYQLRRFEAHEYHLKKNNKYLYGITIYKSEDGIVNNGTMKMFLSMDSGLRIMRIRM